MKSKAITMTLCTRCRIDFESTGEHHVRRANHNQEDREVCTYCSNKFGWDYKVTPKSSKAKR